MDDNWWRIQINETAKVLVDQHHVERGKVATKLAEFLEISLRMIEELSNDEYKNKDLQKWGKKGGESTAEKGQNNSLHKVTTKGEGAIQGIADGSTADAIESITAKPSGQGTKTAKPEPKNPVADFTALLFEIKVWVA